MTRFEYKKSLLAGKERQLLTGDETIVANSVELKVGDAVKWDTDGFIALATAGDKVLGIAEGLVTSKGLDVAPDSGTLDTYTMESDNETDKKYRVRVDIAKDSLYENDSSGTLAQTNLGQFFDLTDEDQIDQSSASDTAGQFQLVRLDPDADADVSKGLFKIAESQLDPYVQQ